MATTDQNRAIYERFCTEVLARGRLDAIDELVDPSVVSHSPFPGQTPGRDGFKRAYEQFRAAFPRLHVTVHDILAEGDKVVGYFTVTGVHDGTFRGIAPTGRAIQYDEMVIVRLKDGRIVEHWSVADSLSMMQSLGMVTVAGSQAARGLDSEEHVLLGHGLS